MNNHLGNGNYLTDELGWLLLALTELQKRGIDRRQLSKIGAEPLVADKVAEALNSRFPNSILNRSQIDEQLEYLRNRFLVGMLDHKLLAEFIKNPYSYRRDVGRFGKVYPLSVVYGEGTLVGLLDAAKLYRTNPLIVRESRNFQFDYVGFRVIKVELFEFEERVPMNEVNSRVEAEGYVSEDLGALLAFSAQYPVEQRRRPVGTTRRRFLMPGGRYGIPFLYGTNHGRTLELVTHRWFEPTYRLLVSKKIDQDG